MSKLYELTAAYNAVWQMVDDEADLQAIQDTLEGIEDEITTKVESLAKLMKSIEADETAMKAEEERLYKRRKAFENRWQSIKKYVEQQLTLAGIDKVKGTIFTVALQNNPLSVKVDESVTLPEIYYIPQPAKLDKEALLEDLKAGKVIPGAELQQTKSLRIR